MKPHIEFSKLQRYVQANGSYSLVKRGDSIEVHFSPNFPEAIPHLPNNLPVEHIMYGDLVDGIVYFYKFETVSSFGTTENLLTDDDPIMEWLKYI
ncbi:hypothetical protein [Thermoplasma volcanium]|uniref:hypothetical protein n=1 Tax=Thermoplasma volcanium TaxID=50339 RepID=UPI0000164E8C|nr:hypothetical protein [Thermoplasma volcanium]